MNPPKKWLNLAITVLATITFIIWIYPNFNGIVTQKTNRQQRNDWKVVKKKYDIKNQSIHPPVGRFYSQAIKNPGEKKDLAMVTLARGATPEQYNELINGWTLAESEVSTLDQKYKNLSRAEKIYMEDYFQLCLDRLEIYRKYNQPVNFFGDIQDIQRTAGFNGWKDEPSGVLLQKKLEKEMNQYNHYLIELDHISEPHFSLIAFLAFLIALYWKGLIISIIIFIARIISKNDRNILKEIFFGELGQNILFWPKGLFIYPNQTAAAVYLKKKRLEAEYRRGKSWSYQLSAREDDLLWQMAREQTSVKILIKKYFSPELTQLKRKSLATVFCLMIFSVGLSTISRGASLTHQNIEKIKVTCFQKASAESGESIHARGSPSPEQHDHGPITGIIPVVDQAISIIVLFFIRITHQTPGRAPTNEIDYIPKVNSFINILSNSVIKLKNILKGVIYYENIKKHNRFIGNNIFCYNLRARTDH